MSTTFDAKADTAAAGSAIAATDKFVFGDVSADAWDTVLAREVANALLSVSNGAFSETATQGLVQAQTATTGAPSPSVTVTRPAHTALTASTEYSDFKVTAATQQFATGALTLNRAHQLLAPTYGFVGASTLATAVNLWAAKPLAGTNATLTRSYAIDAEDSRVQGTLTVMQSGGTAGTDEVRITHTGTYADIYNMDFPSGPTIRMSDNGGNAQRRVDIGSVAIVGDTNPGVISAAFVYPGLDVALYRGAANVLKLTTFQENSGSTYSSVPLSPAQITGNQNNYAPGTARTLRLNSDAARSITGLAAGVDGQECRIVNVGSFSITLVNASGSSSAANQFTNAGGVDIAIGPAEWADLLYDATTTRWLATKVRSNASQGILIVQSLDDSTSKTTINGYTLASIDGSTTIGWGVTYDGGLKLYAYSGENTGLELGQDTRLNRIAANVFGLASGDWLQSTPGRSRVTTTDLTNVTTTLANVTGLSFTAIAGRKYIDGWIRLYVQDGLAADGLKLDLDGGSATWTSFRATYVVYDTSIAAALASGSVTAIATDFTVATVTGAAWVDITFSGVCNAAGTFIPRFAKNSDAAGGTLTLRVDSFMSVEDCP